MAEQKIHRLWKPITFGDEWRIADTSILDDLSSAWFARRARLRLDSAEFQGFLGKLKREHAIETGVVERLYDIERGVTETLIEKGFIDGLLSHGDSNIPSDQLMRHLNDHLEAMDFVFDLIKEDRPLTVGFIRDLHQLVTRSQESAEGRDSQGNKTKIKLVKGKYKEWENNPTRSDGTIIMYCPPIHVSAEMEQLVNIYHALEENKIHPLIIAGWVHHAFTTIHPFQDGNGRVVRLLASLILIKHELFPITVLREEAKVKYILALEKADAGQPSDLVSYFATIQKRQIERALNVDEVGSESLEVVQNLLAEKLNRFRQKAIDDANQLFELENKLRRNRTQIFNICSQILSSKLSSLETILGENAELEIENLDFEQILRPTHVVEILQYSKRHQYSFDPVLPKAVLTLCIRLREWHKLHLFVLILHHFNADNSTMAVGTYHSFRMWKETEWNEQILIETPPHLVSLLDVDMESKRKNIEGFIENALTIYLAQIVKDLK